MCNFIQSISEYLLLVLNAVNLILTKFGPLLRYGLELCTARRHSSHRYGFVYQMTLENNLQIVFLVDLNTFIDEQRYKRPFLEIAPQTITVE